MIVTSVVIFFLTSLILIISWLLIFGPTKPIFKVYAQRGPFYWIKYFGVLFYIYKQKWKYSSRKNIKNDGDNGAEQIIDKIEKPQQLSEHPKAFNTITFIGGNHEGYKFIIGMERRKRGICYIVIHLWIPGRGLFSFPKLPNTIIFSTKNGIENERFIGEGIEIIPLQSMTKWKINYKGNLKQNDQIYSTSIDAEFITNFNYFDLDTDISPWIFAEAMAKEKWKDAYFIRLEMMHQSHYEQIGNIRGKFIIDNKEYDLNLQALKGHSYGLGRDWSSFHRFVYFILFLKNGYTIVIGVVSIPKILSNLKMGYVCTPFGEYSPITNCDFQLYENGENGIPPNDYAFRIETKNDIYTIHIIQNIHAERYVGTDWESKIYDHFISCNVNGIPGYGIVQYLYNNKNNGRPEEIYKMDPKWYKTVREMENYYRKTNEIFLKKSNDP